MTKPYFVVAMERQYAIALGRYETAEHAVETVVGLKGVIAADLRIASQKRALTEKMERISLQIRLQYDPEWEPGHIRPIQPRGKYRPKGEISTAVYRVLKGATQPMRLREIAHLVAPQVGIENADYLQINKLGAVVNGTLQRRLKDGMVVHDGGAPMRWSIKPPAARKRGDASANTQPISATPAASLPAPRPLETDGRC